MPSIINATTTNGVAISPDNSGSLQLATNNGTTAVTIDTSQNVGIGATSPQGKLDVVGLARITSLAPSFPSTGTGLEIYYDGTNDVGRIQSYSRASSAWKDLVSAGNNLLFQTAGSERMRITSGGSVGIGTSSPLGKFVVSNGGANGFEVNPDEASGAETRINSYNRSTSAFTPIGINASQHYWLTSSTERMRIDSSGNVLIGTTNTTTGKLSVVGTNTSTQTFAYFARSGSSAVSGFTTAPNPYSIYANGMILASEFNATSDARLKENINNLTSEQTWQFVNNVIPVSYNWKTDENKAQRIGFIAQNIIASGFPDMVSVYNDVTVSAETIDGIDCPDKVAFNMNYEQVTPILLKAIQELKAELDTVKAELNTLKNPPVEGTE